MRSAGNRLGSVKELESYIRRPRNISSNMAVRCCIPAVTQRVLSVAAGCPHVFTQGPESALRPADSVALESSLRVLEPWHPVQGLQGVLEQQADSDADGRAAFSAVRRLGDGSASRARSCAPASASEWEHLARASTS